MSLATYVLPWGIVSYVRVHFAKTQVQLPLEQMHEEGLVVFGAFFDPDVDLGDLFCRERRTKGHP